MTHGVEITIFLIQITEITSLVPISVRRPTSGHTSRNISSIPNFLEHQIAGFALSDSDKHVIVCQF